MQYLLLLCLLVWMHHVVLWSQMFVVVGDVQCFSAVAGGIEWRHAHELLLQVASKPFLCTATMKLLRMSPHTQAETQGHKRAHTQNIMSQTNLHDHKYKQCTTNFAEQIVTRKNANKLTKWWFLKVWRSMYPIWPKSVQPDRHPWVRTARPPPQTTTRAKLVEHDGFTCES